MNIEMVSIDEAVTCDDCHRVTSHQIWVTINGGEPWPMGYLCTYCGGESE